MSDRAAHLATREDPDPRDLAQACHLMRRFAERTGIGGEAPPRRYLWTDAFAVCNLLALWRATGDGELLRLAQMLVDQVHHVLGRHRSDDARRGWISGLSDAEGEAHPTRGGLRIGKRLPERPADAPRGERLEWDRDGQYFHYLTRWMHALDQLARATRTPRYNVWARELADAAHRAFTRAPAPGAADASHASSRPRMVWKMSIDLARPLVPSMGQHDPLDGLVTCVELRATAAALPGAPRDPDLRAAQDAFARMIDLGGLATADPLGLGGLLLDAARVGQLLAVAPFDDRVLLDALLASAQAGLSHYAARHPLARPASERLAFRELGLSIGLAALDAVGHALERDVRPLPRRDRLRALLDAVVAHRPLGEAITAFWRDPAHQRDPTWRDHQDIDDVMLASALVPDGVWRLAGLQERSP